jgi:hypothetical protein
MRKKGFYLILLLIFCNALCRVTPSERVGYSQNKHPSEAKLRAASFRNTKLHGNYPQNSTKLELRNLAYGKGQNVLIDNSSKAFY